MKPGKIWMVRAGRGGTMADEFEAKSHVAIGWAYIGDLSSYTTRQEIEHALTKDKPEISRVKTGMIVSNLAMFSLEMEKDDYVITYNNSRRVYLLGKIAGGYQFEKDPVLPHTRKVKWEKEIKRDSLSITTKNTLGAWKTVFLLGEDATTELLGDGAAEDEDEAETEDNEGMEVLREVVDNAREFIKDATLKLDWEEMEELVAGILRGMGFKTSMSKKGSDLGKDIVASYDGLGLTEPRIIVEVKHRHGQMGSQDIRSFIGVLRAGDKGMYVSTGGFSKDARYEGERSNIPVALVDLDGLVDLLVENYEKLDSDTKALVPLIHVYWPAS